MKKSLWIIIFPVILALLFSCEKKSDNLIRENIPSADSEVNPGNIWPFLGDAAVTVDENPLSQNYYIVFDGSGSMEENNKIGTAKAALREFIKYIPSEANVGLYVFDRSGTSERMSLGSNRSRLDQEIQKITAGGMTPLKAAIQTGYNTLTNQGRQQLGYGEYTMVVITDGEASQGYDPGSIVNQILAESPVILHTIGFQIGTRHSLNQPGKIYYKAANNFDELVAGLEGVLAELESFSIKDFQE